MNVLVTGGAGYIGSHTAKSLALAGHRPIVLDNLTQGHHWAVRWGPFEHGDLSDLVLLREVLRRYDIGAIVHLAAYAYVGESMSAPGSYFENNAVNSLRLIETARSSGVRHFIFSSTCATYGNPEHMPIAEDHPQRPVNPYGESKLFVEKILRWYGELHGMKWIALRYFNAAGADPDGELGESHNPETHLIPLAIEAATIPDRPLRIFGTDYPTPDGTAIRDYIHVMDLAEAHVRALAYIISGGVSQAINIGTGNGHSVQDVMEMVASITGKKPATISAMRREGDPPSLIADPRRAIATIGWNASHSSLSEMVRTAYLWQCKSRLT